MSNIYKLIIFIPFLILGCAPNVIDKNKVIQKIENLTKQKYIYLAFNKPVGIVCTTDRKVEPNKVIDFIKYPKRIFPIGRLDKLSEGLSFLTNDGDIVNKILRARNNHEKEYIVSVNRPINRDFVQSMSSGVEI